MIVCACGGKGWLMSEGESWLACSGFPIWNMAELFWPLGSSMKHGTYFLTANG